MGYTTYFTGEFEIKHAETGEGISKELAAYINMFSNTRRMKRDVDKIKEVYPNWKEICLNGELGDEGEFFIGGNGYRGQGIDKSVIDHNCPPSRQPGLWCQWVVNADGNLVWDEGEKFYEYIEWLEYIIWSFLEPNGYKVNGEVRWRGEDPDDMGIIIVNNCVIYVLNLSKGALISRLLALRDDFKEREEMLNAD